MSKNWNANAATKTELKYVLYEASVQTPEQHADMFDLMYSDLRGKKASRLREDFCGTFAISCAWSERNQKNEALGLDLDPEPLAFGKKHCLPRLKPEARARVFPLEGNVLKRPPGKFSKWLADITVACNFSFFIFKERTALCEYFRAARKGLRKNGVFILELAGGPGMIENVREFKRQEASPLRKLFGLPEKFTYYWQQRDFDPVTHNGIYSIHFKLDDPKRSWIKDAFTYDWRIWTVPEVRDALIDSGFTKTHVYWEVEGVENLRKRILRNREEKTSKNSPGLEELGIIEPKAEALYGHDYIRARHGDNAYSWIAYIVAER